jgi:GH24 family phage-related lysozyme (muramidase)
VQAHTIQKLAATYNADEQTGQTFYELPAGVQTAITDLAYQYGDGTNLATRTPTYWNDVITGDWSAAVNELNNFGDHFPTRRGLEAKLIQNDIDAGAVPDDSSQGKCQ